MTRDEAREPWDTPERHAQALAHEDTLRRRRRRQSLILLLVVLLILLVLLIALFFARREASQTSALHAAPCPTQTVALPRDTSVRVLNSTSHKGLASKVAATLKGRGYDINAVGNAQRGQGGPGAGVVVYGVGGAEHAKAVAAQIPGVTLRADARTSVTVDLLLGDGYQGTRTTQEAAPLLRQVAIPPGCAAATGPS